MACAFFFDAEPVGEPCVHALDACALCTKPLAQDSDIFMYREDTPFCSDECRHEQMRLDAACGKELDWIWRSQSDKIHHVIRRPCVPLGSPFSHASMSLLYEREFTRGNSTFMYKGDTPFCSDECRHEQMRLDAACARQAAKAVARSQKQFSSGTGSGRARREFWEVSVAS